MFKNCYLNSTGIIIFILFLGTFFITGNVFSQEDPLLKARKLYQQGYYDDSITTLKIYIRKFNNFLLRR